MKVYTTAPLEDPRDAGATFSRLEEIGYDGGFTFEAKHDPFLPLVLAAEQTRHLRLGTAIAIAFARNAIGRIGGVDQRYFFCHFADRSDIITEYSFHRPAADGQ